MFGYQHTPLTPKHLGTDLPRPAARNARNCEINPNVDDGSDFHDAAHHQFHN